MAYHHKIKHKNNQMNINIFQFLFQMKLIFTYLNRIIFYAFCTTLNSNDDPPLGESISLEIVLILMFLLNDLSSSPEFISSHQLHLSNGTHNIKIFIKREEISQTCFHFYNRSLLRCLIWKYELHYKAIS